MTKRMLVDASHPEEIRIAIVEDQRLIDLDIETASKAQIKGNIYLARVTRVEPSLQAAFIDFDGGRQGFLSVNDIHPKYYPVDLLKELESALRKDNRRSRNRRREQKEAREKKSDTLHEDFELIWTPEMFLSFLDHFVQGSIPLLLPYTLTQEQQPKRYHKRRKYEKRRASGRGRQTRYNRNNRSGKNKKDQSALAEKKQDHDTHAQRHATVNLIDGSADGDYDPALELSSEQSTIETSPTPEIKPVPDIHQEQPSVTPEIQPSAPEETPVVTPPKAEEPIAKTTTDSTEENKEANGTTPPSSWIWDISHSPDAEKLYSKLKAEAEAFQASGSGRRKSSGRFSDSFTTVVSRKEKSKKPKFRLGKKSESRIDKTGVSSRFSLDKKRDENRIKPPKKALEASTPPEATTRLTLERDEHKATTETTDTKQAAVTDDVSPETKVTPAPETKESSVDVKASAQESVSETEKPSENLAPVTSDSPVETISTDDLQTEATTEATETDQGDEPVAQDASEPVTQEEQQPPIESAQEIVVKDEPVSSIEKDQEDATDQKPSVETGEDQQASQETSESSISEAVEDHIDAERSSTKDTTDPVQEAPASITSQTDAEDATLEQKDSAQKIETQQHSESVTPQEALVSEQKIDQEISQIDQTEKEINDDTTPTLIEVKSDDQKTEEEPTEPFVWNWSLPKTSTRYTTTEAQQTSDDHQDTDPQEPSVSDESETADQITEEAAPDSIEENAVEEEASTPHIDTNPEIDQDHSVIEDVIPEPELLDDDEEEEDGDDEIKEATSVENEEPLLSFRSLPRRRNIPIQKILNRNQVLLVQVVKEARGNKGASLTTNISLAGRYTVLLPENPGGGGISRKIVESGERKKLKELVSSLKIPREVSLIIRTAGSGRKKQEISRDLDYLLRLWKKIDKKTQHLKAPALIHEEGDLILRTIRDLYSSDMQELLIEGQSGYRRGKDFMRLIMPSYARIVQPYRDRIPLFSRYQIEQQIESMHERVIALRSGGYLVIESTEALVTIDINSGRATREKNVENTAFKTNLQAADEIARQLRLRDLGGLIVIDFIDMEEKKHNIEVERRMRDALKLDRAKIQMGSISQFGLLELSRQRMKPTFSETNREVCPHCQGLGTIRTTESAAIHLFRCLEEELSRDRYSELVYYAAPDVANFLLNSKRGALSQLEQNNDVVIQIYSNANLSTADFHTNHVERTEPRQKPTQSNTKQSKSNQPKSQPSSNQKENEAKKDPEEEDNKHDRNNKRRRKRRRRRNQANNVESDAASSPKNGGKKTKEREEEREEEREQPVKKKKKKGGPKERTTQSGEQYKPQPQKKADKKTKSAPQEPQQPEVETQQVEHEHQEAPLPSLEPEKPQDFFSLSDHNHAEKSEDVPAQQTQVPGVYVLPETEDDSEQPTTVEVISEEIEDHDTDDQASIEPASEEEIETGSNFFGITPKEQNSPAVSDVVESPTPGLFSMATLIAKESTETQQDAPVKVIDTAKKVEQQNETPPTPEETTTQETVTETTEDPIITPAEPAEQQPEEVPSVMVEVSATQEEKPTPSSE
ncbi:Rne/Rng family ribonuclease [Magnetococcales bacterium HHB-1]